MTLRPIIPRSDREPNTELWFCYASSFNSVCTLRVHILDCHRFNTLDLEVWARLVTDSKATFHAIKSTQCELTGPLELYMDVLH